MMRVIVSLFRNRFFSSLSPFQFGCQCRNLQVEWFLVGMCVCVEVCGVTALWFKCKMTANQCRSGEFKRNGFSLVFLLTRNERTQQRVRVCWWRAVNAYYGVYLALEPKRNR